MQFLTELTMRMVVFVEASQPSGAKYRFGFGCIVWPDLVSMVIVLAKLF
jgi:hypothetical protein